MLRKLFDRPQWEMNNFSLTLSFMNLFMGKNFQVNGIPDYHLSQEIFNNENFAEYAREFKQNDEIDLVEEMYQTGLKYELAEDRGNDIKKAIKWYRKAANIGNLKSVYRLGLIYLHGKQGISQNFWKAKYWFTRGAKWGDWDAMWQLGRIYENGWGVEKDIEKACEIYRDAQERGSEDARAALNKLSPDKICTVD